MLGIRRPGLKRGAWRAHGPIVCTPFLCATPTPRLQRVAVAFTISIPPRRPLLFSTTTAYLVDRVERTRTSHCCSSQRQRQSHVLHDNCVRCAKLMWMWMNVMLLLLPPPACLID